LNRQWKVDTRTKRQAPTDKLNDKIQIMENEGRKQRVNSIWNDLIGG